MKADKPKLAGDILDPQAELIDTQRALREIILMIEQSKSEVAKLTQRNASITAHLQQLQGKIDQTPPQEVRIAYEAALDAQQRLFVMRGQLDKLQSDKDHLEKYKSVLERTASTSASATGSEKQIEAKGPIKAA